MTECVVFVTRHTLTDSQRKDFLGWRIYQVRTRAESVRQLWLDIVLCTGTAPNVIVATLPWRWQKLFTKFVAKMSPGTIAVRAMVDQETGEPTGVYMRYKYVYGRELQYEGWLPPRVTMIEKQDET
jgi:hypothetical protein